MPWPVSTSKGWRSARFGAEIFRTSAPCSAQRPRAGRSRERQAEVEDAQTVQRPRRRREAPVSARRRCGRPRLPGRPASAFPCGWDSHSRSSLTLDAAGSRFGQRLLQLHGLPLRDGGADAGTVGPEDLHDPVGKVRQSPVHMEPASIARAIEADRGVAGVLAAQHRPGTPCAKALRLHLPVLCADRGVAGREQLVGEARQDGRRVTHDDARTLRDAGAATPDLGRGVAAQGRRLSPRPRPAALEIA